MWSEADRERSRLVKRHHIRINSKVCVKIDDDKFEIIEKATQITGQNLSEFVKMAALKEARLTMLENSQEMRQLSKDILIEEMEELNKLNEFDRLKGYKEVNKDENETKKQ